jgi:hypothetical protein
MSKCNGRYTANVDSAVVPGEFKLQWICPDHGGTDGRIERDCKYRTTAGALLDAAAAAIKTGQPAQQQLQQV